MKSAGCILFIVLLVTNPSYSQVQGAKIDLLRVKHNKKKYYATVPVIHPEEKDKVVEGYRSGETDKFDKEKKVKKDKKKGKRKSKV
jgi:hypothetical protein